MGRGWTEGEQIPLFIELDPSSDRGAADVRRLRQSVEGNRRMEQRGIRTMAGS